MTKPKLRGRPLTTRGEWMTRNQLALKSGIDRETITKYLALPGAPKPDDKGRFNRGEAMRFIQENAVRAGGSGAELRMLREAILRVDKEDKEIDLAVKRGRLVDNATLEPAVAAFMSQLTNDMRIKFELELPQKLEGKTTLERQQMLEEGVDWVLRRAKEGTPNIGGVRAA